MTVQAIDFSTVKEKQRNAWGSGNYAAVGTTLQIVGENLCEALDLRAGARVLDVAAGNGNATLAAARRFAEVVSTDYVPLLLEAGRRRAEAEGQSVEFREADAENLPFPDASFDVVLSTFGVMFTPNQERAASELLRVCRPGGRIGLANWTPESFVGKMFRVLAGYIPPAPGLKPPSLWGTRPRLAELLGERGEFLRVSSLIFQFRYLSAEHWLSQFRTFYGPLTKAFEALPTERRAALARELVELAESENRSGDDTLVVPSEYLEVVVEKRG